MPSAGPGAPAGPETTGPGAGGGLTGTIVPGVSIAVNRDHAPDQPSGVGGHHSSGCGCDDEAAQMP